MWDPQLSKMLVCCLSERLQSQEPADQSSSELLQPYYTRKTARLSVIWLADLHTYTSWEVRKESFSYTHMLLLNMTIDDNCKCICWKHPVAVKKNTFHSSLQMSWWRLAAWRNTKTYANIRKPPRAPFLLFHCIPHSPTVLIFSPSQSMSPSQPPQSESFILAFSYLSGDNAKTIHAGQTKRSSQPMLKFITTNIINGGQKSSEMEKKDTSVKMRGGISKSCWRREKKKGGRRGGRKHTTLTHILSHTLARERCHGGQTLLHVGLLWGLGCLLHNAEGNQDS